MNTREVYELRWTDILRAHMIAGSVLSHTAILSGIKKEIAKGNVLHPGRGRYQLKQRKIALPIR